jgi:hypothetical protein
MRSTKPGCFDRVLGVFGKLLTRRGAWASWYMMFGLAVQKFLNIECFLHSKLNKIVADNLGGIGMCL